MGPFDCPRCHLRTRAIALFLHRGRTFWRAPAHGTASFHRSCQHPRPPGEGLILGRVAIEN